MNANVQITVPQTSSNIARIAFSMFIHIADVDKNITAQEVRRFQTLIRETSWMDNEDLRQALNELQQHYSTFWANYEDGLLPVNIVAIAEAVQRADEDIGAERAMKLRRAFGQFLERLDGGTYGIKLANSSDYKARQQARKDIASVLIRPLVQAKKSEPANIPVHVQMQVPIPTVITTQDVAAVGSTTAPSSGMRPAVASVAAPVAIPANSTNPPSLPALTPPQHAHLWPAVGLSPGNTPVWNGGKIKVRCVSVLWETEDTKTYNFVAEPRMLFHYKPGQFLTIEVPLPGSVLRRTYTISSSPSRPYVLSITVKKVPMGWMSNWLFDNMVEGLECAVTGPAGKFTCFDHASEKLLFLAAGSGITPTMSMLRWLADTASTASVVFINSVRTPDDIIFHQELLHMSTRLGRQMRLAIVPAAVPPSRPWHGPSGKLDELLIRAYAPDYADRETFVCGPPGYMAMVKGMLAGMGLPAQRYHEESFGGAPVQPAPAPVQAVNVISKPVAPVALAPAASAATAPVAPARPAPAVTTRPTAPTAPPPRPAGPSGPAVSVSKAPVQQPTVRGQVSSSPVPVGVAAQTPAPVVAKMVPDTKEARVFIEGSSEGFIVEPGQTILEAADRAGINIPHSCRSGICGACKMQKVSGKVEMDDQSVLSQPDIDAGYVLTCVGRAVGSVKLAP